MGHRAFVAFGANLGNPVETFAQALRLIERDIGSVKKQSKLHVTEPLVLPGEDPSKHPQYVNGVIEVQTNDSPNELLEHLLAIETQLGRVRIAGERWQPRLIDLDIIAIDTLQIDTPHLRVPHPEMQHRTFVLEPLVEIAPLWRHPTLGMTATELLRCLERSSTATTGQKLSLRT